MAVRMPPSSSTRPVPTRFRMPSASVMTRDSRMPVLVWSKKEIWRRPTWRWTLRRISVIECCAARPRTWERANPVMAWIRVAPPGGQDDPDEQVPLALADDVVEQDLGRAGQDEAGHPGEQQQAESERQASLAGVDELGGVAEDHREGNGFLLLVLVVFGLGGARTPLLGLASSARRSPLRRVRALPWSQAFLWTRGDRAGEHGSILSAAASASRTTCPPTRSTRGRGIWESADQQLLTVYTFKTDNTVYGKGCRRAWIWTSRTSRNRQRAGALLHPLRQRLLSLSREPASASELARRLGLPRQRVNYHVRKLEAAGFLRPAGRARKGNMIEQKYVATARAYVLSPGPPRPGRGRLAGHRRHGLGRLPPGPGRAGPLGRRAGGGRRPRPTASASRPCR